MGACRRCLSSSLYLLVPLVAVLLYFQLQCWREREEFLRTKFNEEYQPDLTDCQAEIQYRKFNSGEEEVSTHLGGGRRERELID